MDGVYAFLWAVPLTLTLLLILIVLHMYRQDGNKQKLMFIISLGFAFVGGVHSMLKSAGFSTFLERSYQWSFMPITFAILLASLSTLLKMKSFDKPFRWFLGVAGLSAVMLASPFSLGAEYEMLYLVLIYTLALLAFLILLFLVVRRRDLIAFLFLLTLLSYMLTGTSFNT